MALPTVPLGPYRITRLIIGGNPFSGFSHQGPERDEEMSDYYTVDRIKRVLFECEAAGINTCLLRTDRHIVRLMREFRNEGGKLQWLAQQDPVMDFDENLWLALNAGAIGYYVQGTVVDRAWARGDLKQVAEMVAKIRDAGVLRGVAAHAPEAHLAVCEAGICADFHMVSLYNCGSLHVGKGHRFEPADPPKAVEAVRRIEKPCIAFKVLGGGRLSAEEGLRFAYENIKPSDMVCLGIYTGDNARMVEEDVRMAEDLLATG